MGCAPSIHISESRETFHGGKEAEDAPGPAAPLPPGQRSLPRRQTTATPGARGAGLAEPKPRDRDRSSDTVRGTGRAAAAFPQGRAGRPPGPGAQGLALGDFDGRRGASCGTARRGRTAVLGPGSVELWLGRGRRRRRAGSPCTPDVWSRRTL